MQTETAGEMKGKAEVWAEVHAAKQQCPHCQRTVTVRTLRWKHVCKRRGPNQILLDAELAERRRRELEQRVVETLNARLRQQREKGTKEASEDSAGRQGKDGGPTGADG